MDDLININTVRGIITAVVFAAFIGIWIWTWSKRLKPEHEETAALPLEEDKPIDNEQETV
jgi:cytochrome c oxidase cbb3-type subunit 4